LKYIQNLGNELKNEAIKNHQDYQSIINKRLIILMAKDKVLLVNI